MSRCAPPCHLRNLPACLPAVVVDTYRLAVAPTYLQFHPTDEGDVEEKKRRKVIIRKKIILKIV